MCICHCIPQTNIRVYSLCFWNLSNNLAKLSWVNLLHHLLNGVRVHVHGAMLVSPVIESQVGTHEFTSTCTWDVWTPYMYIVCNGKLTTMIKNHILVWTSWKCALRNCWSSIDMCCIYSRVKSSLKLWVIERIPLVNVTHIYIYIYR